MSSFFILFSDIPCGTKFLQELIFQIFAVFQKSTEKFLQKKIPPNFLSWIYSTGEIVHTNIIYK